MRIDDGVYVLGGGAHGKVVVSPFLKQGEMSQEYWMITSFYGEALYWTSR